GLFIGRAFDLVAQVLGHAHLFAVAISIGVAVFFHGVAFPLRAFGKNDQRVVTRIATLIGHHQVDQFFQIDLIFGNAAADGGDVRGVERGVSGIAPENAKDADALVRAYRG